jgi:hypothetical protein
MSYYENMAQNRVNEALQEGTESQRAYRNRRPRKSRIRGLVQSVAKAVSKLKLAGKQERTTALSRATKHGEA